MTESGRERVETDATARAVAIEIVSRPVASSLDEAAAVLGLEPRSIVKTLVVKRHDGSFVFALVPGDRRISRPKLRDAVGVNKLRLPDAASAL